MKISFASPSPSLTLAGSGTLVVGVFEGKKLTPYAERLNDKTGGAFAKALKPIPFNGEKGKTVSLLALPGINLNRVLVLGLGKPGGAQTRDFQNLGGRIVAALNAVGENKAHVMVDASPEGKSSQIRAVTAATVAAQMAYGMRLRSYRFDKYRTKYSVAEKAAQKSTLKSVTLMLRGASTAQKAYQPLSKIADGVDFTRDLISEPANVLYPQTLAAEASTLKKLGVKVKVLGEKEIQKLGMGALIGVAQGSDKPPRVVTLEWNGIGHSAKGDETKTSAKITAKNTKNNGPIAFVGKGVTFDTGGISIKPSGGMEDMKWDMGGAGVVIGLMKALAGRKAKVHAVGVVGLVENMPSGNAQRPGDIVTSMSGQTIEVLNTDAEGRLVLADALWYCQEKFKPQAIVDLATLTGAVIIALGDQYAGLFSNDDKLSVALEKAGKAEGEGLWRLPLGKSYDKQLDCDIADMKNITGQRGAGSITAAQFLQRFVKKGTPWAHLDIAGVTWSKKDAPTVPRGGTGFGVRLLDRLVADEYEVK